MGRRRAIVLGAVHVLVLLHVTHWLTSGSTLSPVEPSESMATLELGEVNAGFVFFVLALISTAIFGRFFCGWGCHVVALQDLCGWMMKKLGVRPRLFRSRLLPWAPFVLALYMFVWPTAKRLLANAGIVPGPVRAFPGFTDHLITSEFWATFPSVAVAVPFLLICGFGTVYLLGAKGFCTYGCPYGAFFGVVDTVAPGRIRVTSACEGCGICTSVCTSNVRVHEEVRDHKMVVDPGCMKCMDCVQSCPTNALYFGFGAPALGGKGPTKTKRRFDLDWPQEFGLGAVFLLTFLAWRSVYDQIPLLMAMGVAACITFLVWILDRLAKAPDVRLQNLRLKQSGRWRGAGIAVAVLTTLLAALTMHSGAIRIERQRAEGSDTQVAISRADALAIPLLDLPAPGVDAARQSARHYRRADRIDHGGWGLLATPDVIVRRAWLAVVLRKWDEALTHLDRLGATAPDSPLGLDRARILRLAGRGDRARQALDAVIATDPVNVPAHRELAELYEAEGDLTRAAAELIIVASLDANDRTTRARVADLLERLGRLDEAARYR